MYTSFLVWEKMNVGRVRERQRDRVRETENPEWGSLPKLSFKT